eukprot:11544755-Heterocapsa_arctica.AAC.1
MPGPGPPTFSKQFELLKASYPGPCLCPGSESLHTVLEGLDVELGKHDGSARGDLLALLQDGVVAGQLDLTLDNLRTD